MPILRITLPRPKAVTAWTSADYERVSRMINDFSKNRRKSHYAIRDGKVFNRYNTTIMVDARVTDPDSVYHSDRVTRDTEYIEVRVRLYCTDIACFRVTRSSVQVWNDGWNSHTTHRRVRQAETWFTGFGIRADLRATETTRPTDPARLAERRQIGNSLKPNGHWYSKHHIRHFGRKFYFNALTMTELEQLEDGHVLRCAVKTNTPPKRMERRFRGVRTNPVKNDSILDLYMRSIGIRKEGESYLITPRNLTPEILTHVGEYLPTGLDGSEVTQENFYAWLKFQKFNVFECEIVMSDVEQPTVILTRRRKPGAKFKPIIRYSLDRIYQRW